MPSGPSGAPEPSGSTGGMESGIGEPLPWPDGEGASGGGLDTLDQQLDESLGDFDETMTGGSGGGPGEEEIDILDPMSSGGASGDGDEPLYEEGDLGDSGDGMYEDEGIAQRAADGAPGGSSGATGGQQGGAAGAADSAAGDPSGAEQAGGSSSAGGGGAAPPGAEAGGTSASSGANEGTEEIIPIPDDVGDGRNDDIVLRQIREAAMKETDPVLRERLWDEYRRIRGQR